MKILRFDIYGRVAHFRKFYSNVTSLSYYFPPRNTIIGIIATILGMQRDSYYDILSNDNLGIALQILKEPRKLLVSMDYLDIQGVDIKSMRGITGMKPTKIELVFPMTGDEIGYRVFAAAKNAESEKVLIQLHENISQSKCVYPVSLGPQYCLAKIDEETILQEAEIIPSDGKEARRISTVIPSDEVLRFEPNLMQGKRIMLEEALPPDFRNGRVLAGGSRNYIFEARGFSLDLFLKSDLFRVIDGDYGTYGTFM